MTAAPARRTVAPATHRSAPALAVVPRRRRAAGFAVLLSFLVVTLMLGAAMLHTRLAERQLEIDRLEGAVAEAQDRFDVLRRQRAELRAPTRLAEEAGRLGMRTAVVSEFVDVDGLDLARAIAATGRSRSSERITDELDPLGQIRLVKAVTNAANDEAP
jgi:cell division protein FtsL